MVQISYDSRFHRQWKKYIKKNTPSEKESIRERLRLFEKDIFHPKLRTHKLKGDLGEYYSFTLVGSERIRFRILDAGHVFFYFVGDHDDVY